MFNKLIGSVLFGFGIGCSQASPPEHDVTVNSAQRAQAAGLHVPREEGHEACSNRLRGSAYDVATADMDGDGRLDLVAAQGAQGPLECILILRQPNVDDPPPSWPTESLGPRGQYHRVAVGDIDRDGFADVVALTTDHRTRFWLSGGAPLSNRAEANGEMLLDSPRCILSGVTCERDASSFQVLLSSVALADNGQNVFMVISSYSEGATSLVPLRFFKFDRGTRVFQPTETFCGRSALKVQFFDMDGNNTWDVITSHYWVKNGQWGEWWQRDKAGTVEPIPWALPISSDALRRSGAVLSAVDFDLHRNGGDLRFAVALSAHHCEHDNCWIKAQGGFSVVLDRAGTVLWSSENIEKGYVGETATGDRRTLVPRIVRFAGDTAAPHLLVGYWLAKKGDNPGQPAPFLWGDLSNETSGSFSVTAYIPMAVTPFERVAPSPCPKQATDPRTSCSATMDKSSVGIAQMSEAAGITLLDCCDF